MRASKLPDKCAKELGVATCKIFLALFVYILKRRRSGIKGLQFVFFIKGKAECFKENTTIQALHRNKCFIPLLNVQEMK